MQRRYANHVDEAEVDMTPMLDIVFIMLIFFIVTASFIKADAIAAQRPAQNQSTDLPNKQAIFINIEENGQIWMDNRRIDVTRVSANIESILANFSTSKVLVKADSNAKHLDVMAVMDQIKENSSLDIVIVSEH